MSLNILTLTSMQRLLTNFLVWCRWHMMCVSCHHQISHASKPPNNTNGSSQAQGSAATSRIRWGETEGGGRVGRKWSSERGEPRAREEKRTINNQTRRQYYITRSGLSLCIDRDGFSSDQSAPDDKTVDTADTASCSQICTSRYLHYIIMFLF